MQDSAAYIHGKSLKKHSVHATGAAALPGPVALPRHQGNSCNVIMNLAVRRAVGLPAQHPRPGRVLHQLEAAPSITGVQTAEELLDAFERGARDIEITRHLDLRGVQPIPKDDTDTTADLEAQTLRHRLLISSEGNPRSMRVRSAAYASDASKRQAVLGRPHELLG